MLLGVTSLLSSCVTDQYGYAFAGGPTYMAGPYGDPYFIYGSTYYYRNGPRYYYYDHGRQIYVNRLPSRGHYYFY